MQSIIFFNQRGPHDNARLQEIIDSMTVPGLRIYCMDLESINSKSADVQRLYASMRLAVVPIENSGQTEILRQLDQRLHPPTILLRSSAFAQFQSNYGEPLPDSVFGCVDLGATPPVLLSAIHMVLSGGRCFPVPVINSANQPNRSVESAVSQDRPAYRQYLIDRFSLTERQVDILYTMRQGLSAKEAAQKLNIAPGTIKTHSERIYMRLNVRNRAQAVFKAFVDSNTPNDSDDEPESSEMPRLHLVRSAMS